MANSGDKMKETEIQPTLACVAVFWLLILSRLFTVLRPFNSLANVVLFLVSRPSVIVMNFVEEENYRKKY